MSVRSRSGGSVWRGREFAEQEKTPARRFGRHQVAELPPTAVLFFEHRTHHLRCPGCGKKTVAELPDEVAGSTFGLDLQAAVVTLTARSRVSRRDVSELALHHYLRLDSRSLSWCNTWLSWNTYRVRCTTLRRSASESFTAVTGRP